LAKKYLGGTLTFISDASRGTRFALVIPDQGAPSGGEVEPRVVVSPPPEVAAPPRPGTFTVMVVDDSRTSRAILRSILSQEHHVITAATGEEGLELAVKHLPDLILLDVVMPGMDGFAICARLKSDPRTEEIPVLFLSVLGGEADETLALEAGAIDFITKPISPAVVAARVRNHLEWKRSKDLLRTLATLDGLTGIANRGTFDRQLEVEWQRTRRRGLPLAVILGDVDYFKDYNDGYGHPAGDACLKSIAACFAAATQRPGDLAARYGGEEFVCLLPETDLCGAQEVAERIRLAVAAMNIAHAHSKVAEFVTVSLGAAHWLPSEGGSGEDLLRLVDTRLYAAKAAGRNRVL